MSSLSKMLSILDLFTVEKPMWSSEAICEWLGCSVPTGYRYLRELVTSGLLLRLGNGSYALGPRVMTLDYQLRTVDPFFKAGQSLMHELSTQTGCDCVMTRIFDEEIVDTHHEFGADGLRLAYGRGRPRPLFRGAAPKVILSTMTRSKLNRLFHKHQKSVREAGMGATADEFWGALQPTRKAGYYISKGELEENVCAIAAPLFADGPQAIGALALVIPLRRFEFMNHEKLLELLRSVAERISAAVEKIPPS